MQNIHLPKLFVGIIDGRSKNIKLADPELVGYNYFPELFLVDTTYCVKS